MAIPGYIKNESLSGFKIILNVEFGILNERGSGQPMGWPYRLGNVDSNYVPPPKISVWSIHRGERGVLFKQRGGIAREIGAL